MYICQLELTIHAPARAAEFIVYQHIITSASTQNTPPQPGSIMMSSFACSQPWTLVYVGVSATLTCGSSA